MKIVDHTLREELDKLFENYDIDRNRIAAYKAWPVISGPQLSAVTVLKSIQNGVLRVYTNSSSAKSLLLLNKKKIVEKYNKAYPTLGIVDLEILKRA